MSVRKWFSVALSLSIAVLILLTACGPTAAPAVPTVAPSPEVVATAEVAPTAGEVSSLTPEGAATGKLEVFSWWTSGGEAAALESLFTAYKAANPDVEIVNATVAGGGGSAARGVLQTRLAGGDPPDTWQVHPGFELLSQYVEPAYVAPVTDLYEEQGWFDVTPKALTDLMTKDGEVYQVTVGVHRGNGLWYNKKVLDANGITVGETMSVDEFFQIAEKLKAAGVTPLCVGDSGIWATAELFENTLLGVLGPESMSACGMGRWHSTAPRSRRR